MVVEIQGGRGLPRVRLPDFRGLRAVRQDVDAGSLSAVCAGQGGGRENSLPPP